MGAHKPRRDLRREGTSGLTARDSNFPQTMLQPDFNPEPVAVRLHRCGYVAKCKARSCSKRATVVAEKVDAAGRHARQIELCERHCEIAVERERARGLQIADRREQSST